MLLARRCHGLVETPTEDKQETSTSFSSNPPSLMRRHSVTGNVLILEQHTKEDTVGHTKAFLLQRKVGTTAYGGSIRVGFRLRDDRPANDGLWHVSYESNVSHRTGTTTTEGTSRKRDHAMMEDIPEQCEMVTVYIENDAVFMKKSGDEDDNESEKKAFPPGRDNLYTEFAALQYIAKQSSDNTGRRFQHLWGTMDVGKDVDSGWVCAVLLPWHSDGTLLDYCSSQSPTGTLPLEEAKFFFRQIVAVR
jgi:hypothetical protein